MHCMIKDSLGVDVHRGSVLIPLLLIVMLEALFTEFRIYCPFLMLHKDDPLLSSWRNCWWNAWNNWKENGLHVKVRYEAI